MSALDAILIQKKHEVQRAKVRLPTAVLQTLVDASPAPISFEGRLRRGALPRIIAEVKRASPSRGLMRPAEPLMTWSPVELAKTYESNGAAALSVLTDVRFFWGEPDLIQACKEVTDLPILRKDFIVDPYQVLESRWLGADCILLLVRAMEPKLLADCATLAYELGMDVLVEVHHYDELSVALGIEKALIGVNQRDLGNMKIVPHQALAMKELIPENRLVVLESGVDGCETMQSLMEAGFFHFLVGTHLVEADDPGHSLRDLLGRGT